MNKKKNHIRTSIAVLGNAFYEREVVFLSHRNIIESTFKNINGKFELTDPISGTCRISRKNMPKKHEIWDVEYDYWEEEADHSCLTGLTGGSGGYYEAKGDSMFEDMIKKHVTVFRKDGNILQGFITDMDQKFIKMTELDNNMIVFSKDCIDLIRLGIQDINPVQEVEQVPKMEFVSQRSRRPIENTQTNDYGFNDENPAYDEKAMASTPGEFAMAIPRLSDDFEKPKKPVFHRATEKE